MSLNILIVDDSKVSRMMTKRTVLGVREDCTFIEGENGQEATELFTQESIDLVIMDVNMPVMDGFEATSIIREIAPNIPVMILSANIQSSSREKAESLGASFYKKPITNDSVIQMLEGL
ncbi:response regulator [Vibrio tritonius]|uniref:response regulator n=1 Tax=Vibrio tritonius TaxID=1435069 RepID=UPI000837E96C|nr:response regulator [Vibrio tritonius]